MESITATKPSTNDPNRAAEDRSKKRRPRVLDKN
jgi:hypothetical protein